MSEPPLLLFDDGMLGYDFGRQHPMAPHRVALTMRLAAELGVLERFRQVSPAPADDRLLLRVHHPDYIAAVRRADREPGRADPAFGLGTPDNPAVAGMHAAARTIAAASVQAAHAVATGRHRAAVNLMGGLHHAMPGYASGFCIYNDAALAVAQLLDAGVERVAYVDVDAHHGDGVEAVFADDPRVLTISLHESPMTLFPGTGRVDDVGGAAAAGFAVNVPLPAETGDGGWWRAFGAIVPPILRAFRPQVLVSQQGADGHACDPLTHLRLTVDLQRASYLALRHLADELTEGRWVVLGGGGYATVEVVPRAWTHLLAVVAGRPIDPATPTPPGWRSYVAEHFGRSAPTTMSNRDDADALPDPAAAVGDLEPWSAFDDGHDPADPVDQLIARVRRTVFPYHGLAPDW
jgi:acetoin utilization protein AcuC